MKIAWIGTGVMGNAMVQHLTPNYEVKVYNRSKEKMLNLVNEATLTDSIQECVQDCDFIFTMVAYPKDVEEIYLGKDGIIEHAKRNAILVDMTTSSPQLAEKIAQKASDSEKGLSALDAPVSGGDIGAKKGTLSIMVGGRIDTYEKTLPLFEKLGTNINYIGKAGCGQHSKMCNQIAVAGATAAYSEALVYMKENGLDYTTVLNAIGSGAAGSWQMEHMAPRVLNNDFEPGFFIKHFTKDMRIAKSVMEEKGTPLKMLECVYQMYETLEETGFAEMGTQALIKYYHEEN